MKRIVFLVLCVYSIAVKAQNCRGFEEGTFEMRHKYGTTIVEKSGDWQLEKSEKYGVVYLNKIEKINDCKFILRYYRVIKPGGLPEPDMTKKATTEITNVEGSSFYFKSSMIDTDVSIEGVFIKKSEQVSEEFKKLITKEKVPD